MMSFKPVLFLLLFLFVGFAEARRIELEFEKVDDAVRYQFEFRKETGTEIIKTISQSDVFVEIELPFDHYEYRQRAFDKRNVPGDWSSWEKFVVTVPEFTITAPVPDAELKSEKAKVNVRFQWQGGEGVEKFKILIQDMITNQIIEEKVVEGRTTEISLPTGSLYQARVQTILNHPLWPDLDTAAQVQFSVQAGSLESAQVQTEKNKFMRAITWTAEPLAEYYDVTLERISNTNKKWVTVFQDKNLKANQLEFDPKWSGGNYRLKIISKAKYRKDSPLRIEKFYLASNRSPIAEYNESVTRAIDRINGYYGQASWLMTQVHLTSSNVETGTEANTKPQGGTLRAGFGYFKYDANWGVSSFLNITGMQINNQFKDYTGIEVNAVYRTRFSFRDELRVSLGLSDLQVPVLIGNSSAGVSNITKSNVFGPKIAIEYWYSLGPKIGVQAHYSRNFYNLTNNNSSPNGNTLKVPVSFQAGIMASYRFSTKITGLLGLVHQEENYKYEALARSGPQPIAAGTYNEGALKADYIGLMAEIGF